MSIMIFFGCLALAVPVVIVLAIVAIIIGMIQGQRDLNK